MLEIRNLEVSYGAIRVLHGVDCHINPGEIVALLGPNGAGKSTIINAAAGLVAASAGSINLDGENITNLRTHRRARMGLSLVMERRHMFPLMSVAENLMMGARIGDRATDDRHEMPDIYDLFPSIYGKLSERAGTLSGGEQQMVAIARGLLTRPRVLLIDEPFLGLAPKVVDVITSAMLQLRSLGMPLLFIEQNVRIACEVSDRLYLLRSGEIAFSGSPRDAQKSGVIDTVYFGKS